MRSDSRPHTYALGHHGFSGEWASIGFVYVHDPYGSERMDLALTGVGCAVTEHHRGPLTVLIASLRTSLKPVARRSALCARWASLTRSPLQSTRSSPLTAGLTFW